MWPEEFKKIGKIDAEYPQMFATKYRQDAHKCPLDKSNEGSLGCFFSCRAFQSDGEKLTLEKVKELYRSEEHTSELQSHSFISYAVFCLKKKTQTPLLT